MKKGNKSGNEPATGKQSKNELKNLITTPRVKYRRPYDIHIEEYPHLASFMASVNGKTS